MQEKEGNPLSEREIEILTLSSQGYSLKEIARLLSISYNTAECHRKNIRNKLGFNMVASALYAVKQGIIPMPENFKKDRGENET